MYNELLLSAGGGFHPRNQFAPQDIDPHIFIGIGGTGLDALRRVKKAVYQHLEPDDPKDPIPKYEKIKFLAIDTDTTDLRKGGKRTTPRLTPSLPSGPAPAVAQRILISCSARSAAVASLGKVPDARLPPASNPRITQQPPAFRRGVAFKRDHPSNNQSSGSMNSSESMYFTASIPAIRPVPSSNPPPFGGGLFLKGITPRIINPRDR